MLDEDSWMDRSIRMHLQCISNRNVNEEDGLSDGDEAVVVMSPPTTLQMANESASSDIQILYTPGKEAEDYRQIPCLVAEIVSVPSRQDEPHQSNEDQLAVSSNNGERLSEEVGMVPTAHVAATSSAVVRVHPKNRRKIYKGLKKKNKNKRKKVKKPDSFVIPRTSLPYSIEHNEMTMEWIAMINTNQDAIDEGDTDEVEEHLATESFKTLQEARAFCHAYCPPRMHSFDDRPNCHLCKKSFNKILRRPTNCKNCGVCICSNCSVSWPTSMLPPTYICNTSSRLRNRRLAKVCGACDWLQCEFRQQILSGNLDKAVALHATGNVNSRSPFANTRGESFYPVHCAILSGSLSLFKWLVDDLHCPINSKRRKLPMSPKGPLASLAREQVRSSKGSSVLDVAMEAQELGILHYLVIEKGVSIMDYKNLFVALRTFEATLRHLPVRFRSTARNSNG